MSLTIKKHDIRIFRDCIRSNSEKWDIQNRQKINFLLISTKNIHCVQVFIFMKQQRFFRILWSFIKIIEILVKNVEKTALPHLKRSHKKPNQKWVKSVVRHLSGRLFCRPLFIVQFSTRYLKRPSWTFFIKSTPNRRIWGLKKSPKKPNQKWVKCCVKAPIRQAVLQISLFIVQFSTRCWKTPSWIFLVKNQPQTEASEALVKSLLSVPSASSLSTATW